MNPKSRRTFFKIAMTCALALVIPTFLVGCGEKHDHAVEGGTIYTCSMHPQIRSNKPGRCPICGMTLTPIKAEEKADTTEKSTHSQDVKLMPAQDSIASVVTTAVTANVLVRPVTVFGEIRYIQDSHVDFTWVYSGRIEKLLIPYSTTEVTKGQPLLEIYSEEAIADQQGYLQALRERYLTTFYERKIATAQIETFRAKLARAGMTDHDFTNLEKNKTIKTTFTLTAPIAGSIVSIPPHVGERVAPDRVLFHIGSLDKVWFAAKVFEQDISALSLGQEIDIETKARPGQKYRGKLFFIDRAIEPETRTILARFAIDNPKRELLPEMSATGFLRVKTTGEVLTIPASAIIDTGKRKIVYVAKDNHTYEQREVTVGIEGNTDNDSGKLIEIKSGLASGEKVVSSGAFLIDAEAQLRGSVSSEHKH